MLRTLTKLFYVGREKPYAGLISGDKLKMLIDNLLPDPNIRVENLKTPFAAIAVVS